MNRFDSRRGWGKSVLMLTVAVFVAGALSGCEPLRKKFVRKKKNDRTNEVIPVLDPVDYPALERSPLSVYQYHYNLWKVWLKDLTTALDDHDGQASRKQLAGMMDQLDIQLEGMQDVLSGEDEKAFDGFRADLKKVAVALEEPAAIRDDKALKARVMRLDKTLRNRFGLKTMKEKLEPGLDGSY